MKKKPIHFMISSAVAVLLVSGCQSAKDPFAIADTDGDDAISKAEFERFMLEAIYTEADADGDAKVTFEEWKVMNPDSKKDKFLLPDADKDGSISPEELKAYFNEKDTFGPLHVKIDTDGDNSLSREEVEVFYQKAEQAAGATSLQKISNAASE